MNTCDVRNQWETNIEAPDVTLTVLFQEEKLTSTTKNKKKSLSNFLAHKCHKSESNEADVTPNRQSQKTETEVSWAAELYGRKERSGERFQF